MLGRNGTYLVFRKLHTRVADFRRYVRSKATSRADEGLLAAKFVGCWPSGAPLDLAPDKDDPELGADPARNNDFRYRGDDRGLRCPLGAHARRMNARDATVIGEVRLHRMIRRSASYGPMLPPDVLDDLALHLGTRAERLLALGLNTPTYSYAYHDAVLDGLAQLARQMWPTSVAGEHDARDAALPDQGPRPSRPGVVGPHDRHPA